MISPPEKNYFQSERTLGRTKRGKNHFLVAAAPAENRMYSHTHFMESHERNFLNSANGRLLTTLISGVCFKSIKKLTTMIIGAYEQNQNMPQHKCILWTSLHKPPEKKKLESDDHLIAKLCKC